MGNTLPLPPPGFDELNIDDQGEALLGGPATHVSADLGDQLQGGVGSDPTDLREINAARELRERRTDLEPAFVVARR